MNKKQHESTRTSTLDDDSLLLAEAAAKRRNRTQQKNSTRKSYTDREETITARKNATPYNPYKLVKQDQLKHGWKGFKHNRDGKFYYRFKGKDNTMTPIPPYINTANVDRSDVDQEALQKMGKLKQNYQKKISAMGTSRRISPPQTSANKPGRINTPEIGKKKNLTRKEAENRVRAKIKQGLPPKTDKFDPYGPGNAPKKSLSLSSSLQTKKPESNVHSGPILKMPTPRRPPIRAWGTPRKGWKTKEAFEEANQWANENNKDPYQNTTREASRYTREREAVMQKQEKEKREQARKKRLAELRKQKKDEAEKREELKKNASQNRFMMMIDWILDDIFKLFNINNLLNKHKDEYKNFFKKMMSDEQKDLGIKVLNYFKSKFEKDESQLIKHLIELIFLDKIPTKVWNNKESRWKIVDKQLKIHFCNMKHIVRDLLNGERQYVDGQMKLAKKATQAIDSTNTGLNYIFGRQHGFISNLFDSIKNYVLKTRGEDEYTNINKIPENERKRYLNMISIPIIITCDGWVHALALQDGTILSQTKEQRRTNRYTIKDGKTMKTTEARGRFPTADEYMNKGKPKSISSPHKNEPITDKFFRKQNISIKHYFLYFSEQRAFEQFFYDGEGNFIKHIKLDKLKGNKAYSSANTLERHGNINRSDDFWYSQQSNGPWVWKQNMSTNLPKQHVYDYKLEKEAWKESQKYIRGQTKGKPKAFKRFFQEFIAKIEDNSQYILFNGGRPSSKFPTVPIGNVSGNKIKLGFIDTTKGILLGDYYMFECINNYFEEKFNSPIPVKETPLTFYIHKDHLHPPKKGQGELDKWAKQRSIISEYEYRSMIFARDGYDRMMSRLTDFKTATKYCENPLSLNRDNTAICIKNDDGSLTYKSALLFPTDEFGILTDKEFGYIGMFKRDISMFIDDKNEELENLEDVNCDKDGEPCFGKILDLLNIIINFKDESKKQLDKKMEELDDYTDFLSDLLNNYKNIEQEDRTKIDEEIKATGAIKNAIENYFDKIIKSKDLTGILTDLFNRNIEKLISLTELNLVDLEWAGLGKDKGKQDTIQNLKNKFNEQKTNFDNFIVRVKEKDVVGIQVDNALVNLQNMLIDYQTKMDEYINAYENNKKKAEEDAEKERIRKEEEAKRAAAEAERKRLEAEAKRAAEEAKKRREEEARLLEKNRKQAILGALKQWGKIYEKKKKEEEERKLWEEIRNNYNAAIQHNIKVRDNIVNILAGLKEKEDSINTDNPDSLYPILMDPNSQWSKIIKEIKSDNLESKLKNELKSLNDVKNSANKILDEYKKAKFELPYTDKIIQKISEINNKIVVFDGWIQGLEKEKNNIDMIKNNFDESGKIPKGIGFIDIAFLLEDITPISEKKNESVESVAEIPKTLLNFIDAGNQKLLEKKKFLEKERNEKNKEFINRFNTSISIPLDKVLSDYYIQDEKRKIRLNIKEDDATHNDKWMEITDTTIPGMEKIVKLIDQLKAIMEEEKRVEEEIENLSKERPDENTDEQTKVKFYKNIDEVQKSNSDKLNELKTSFKNLNASTQELITTQPPEVKDYFKNIEKAKKEVDDIWKIYEEMIEEQKKYEETLSDSKLITQLNGFREVINWSGLKKKHIEHIYDNKDLTAEKDIDKILKEINITLVNAPELLKKVFIFKLEEKIYDKVLEENNKFIAIAEKANMEASQERKRIEDELEGEIERKKEEERKRIEEEIKRKREQHEREVKLANDKMSAVEIKLKKLLNRHKEPSKYKEYTENFNDKIMQMAFKSPLLHAEQEYIEEKTRKQDVDKWYSENIAKKEEMDTSEITYEDKLDAYNKEMKKTNEIFG